MGPQIPLRFIDWILASLAMLTLVSGACGADVTLSNSQIGFRFSQRSGVIVAGYALDRPEKIFGYCSDVYQLETAHDTRVFREDEFRVTSFHSSHAMVTFECVNPTKDILLRKRYSLSGPILEKNVEIISKRGELGFVSSWTEVEVVPSFRKKSYYYVPYPNSNVDVNAKDIPTHRTLRSDVYPALHTLACALFDPSRQLVAASYLYELDGFFSTWRVGTALEEGIERFDPVATPKGWRHFLCLDYLNDKVSYTSHYTILRGDPSQLLWQYFSLPSLEKIRNNVHPNWIQDVKLAMFNYPWWETALADDFLTKLLDLSNQLGSGYIMPIFNYYGHLSGDYPLEGNDVQFIAAQVKKLHAKSKKVKIGMYIIPFCFDSKSSTFQEHQDWAVRKKDGSYPQADFPGRYPLQVARSDAKDFFAHSIADASLFLDLDFLYVDGGEHAFLGHEDWANRMVCQNKDTDSFYRQILELMRAQKPEMALFVNVPASYLADCSFQEMPEWLWGIEGPPVEIPGVQGWAMAQARGWRCLSDALEYAKIGQREGTWVSHLYPFDLKKYFAYMLALSLKPNFAPFKQEDFQVFAQKWLPYVNAVYEVRHALLVNAELSPNWRLSLNLPVEVHALRQSSTILITAINHSPDPLAQPIEADIRQLGLSDDLFFIWDHDMIDPSRVEKNGVSVNGFRVMPRPDTKLKLDTFLLPGLTKVFSVSLLPIFVKSIENVDCQFRLSQTQGIEISGKLDTQKIHASVHNPYGSCQLMIWKPIGWQSMQVVLDGKPVGSEQIEEFGHQFAVITVPRGTHSLVASRPSAY